MVSELVLIDCPRGCDPRKVESLHLASLAAFGASHVQVRDQARAADAGTQLYLLSFANAEARKTFMTGQQRAALEHSWRALGARWMTGDFTAALAGDEALSEATRH